MISFPSFFPIGFRLVEKAKVGVVGENFLSLEIRTQIGKEKIDRADYTLTSLCSSR